MAAPKFHDLANIVLSFDMTLIRLYYANNEYFIIKMNRFEMLPVAFKTVKETVEYLFDQMQNSSTEIQNNLFYPTTWSRKKKQKQKKLTKLHTLNETVLKTYLTLLL